MAGRGLKTVLVARRLEQLEQLAHSLEKTYASESLVLSADLSTAAGLARVDEATAHLDVGLFVTSAGFGTSGPLLDANLKVEHELIELNCYAVLHACQLFGRRFRQRGSGGLILLSSLVGWQGTPWSANYAATKAYVQSLAEALSVELKAANIDVLASAPGPVRSGFASRAGMTMNTTVSPRTVALASLNALGRKETVIPGLLSKALTWSLLPLSRSMRSRVMGSVMSRMANQ